jgi:hypothetical protein
MDKWLKYLVGISAIVIAGCAAFFSITGLGILFAGASISVMVMAGTLEYAKLVTATYLKQKWDILKGFNKWYLTVSVIILMAITSAGIFGYLSNAFQQQNIKLDQVAREIQVWQNKIEFNNKQIVDLKEEQGRQSKTQDKFLEKGNLNNIRISRSLDKRDAASTKLTNKIGVLNDSIVAYNGHINDIKNTNIELEREVGGFRFVAEAFGMSLNGVVKLFIFLIVIVFDPLAIALVIAFNQLVMAKKEEEEIPSNPEDLKNFVDESTRLRLTEDDLKKLEETLLSPPPPNENLMKAAEEYKRRGELLTEIMKNDQELGLYDESFDNPMIKENISDWDVTLMDGLEDEEPFFTEEEMEKILQEEPTEEEIQRNFSTIEPETENIFQEDDFTTPIIEDNDRMDIIGQNGNEGLHYDETSETDEKKN